MKLDFEKFLNVNGLKVGDRIKLVDNNEIYEIVTNETHNFLYLENARFKRNANIQFLNFDFEKVETIKSKKTFGDLMCCSTKCAECPLNSVRCRGVNTYTIKQRFEETIKFYPELEPMRAYFEAELNKEVKE